MREFEFKANGTCEDVGDDDLESKLGFKPYHIVTAGGKNEKIKVAQPEKKGVMEGSKALAHQKVRFLVLPTIRAVDD